MKMAAILDGKALSLKMKGDIKKEVEELKAQGVKVGLAVIIVGENPASKIYVRNKERDCIECGIDSRVIRLTEDCGEEKLLSVIDELNRDDNMSGILVQLPLPRGFDTQKVIEAIDKNKDVDAFNPYNIGKVMRGDYEFVPCTPAGVMRLLDEYNIDVKGKKCVVVGRSDIVGKPMAMLLLHRHATVTICHSRTVDLPAVCREADVLVSAVGRENLITADMVKPGAVVVDVAMNRREDGTLCGDVDFSEVEKKASYITPVPGGIGPMTRIMLLINTLIASKKRG